MNVSLAMAVALVAVMGLGAYFDLRARRIPNALTVSGLAIGLALRSFMGTGALLEGLLGAGLALLLVLPLFALGGFGGGDAKLLIAAGAFLGTRGFLVALALTAVIGGAMALAEAHFRGGLRPLVRDTGSLALHLVTFGKAGSKNTLATPETAKLPYGVAIALGSLGGWLIS